MSAHLKILLTGASGFVGSYLRKHLSEKGFAIETSSRQQLQILYDENLSLASDQMEYWRQKLRDVKLIIHCAGLAHDVGQSQFSSELYDKVNFTLTRRLAELADQAGVVDFVFLSTSKVLTDGDRMVWAVDDQSEVTATGPYARSKRAAEEYLNTLKRMRVMVLRPGLIYGPGAKGNLDLLKRLILKRFWIPVSSRENQRSLLSLTYLAHVIEEVARDGIQQRGEFLIADDTPISTRKLCEAMAREASLAGLLERNQGARFIVIPDFMIRFFYKILPGRLKRLMIKVFGDVYFSNQKIHKVYPAKPFDFFKDVSKMMQK